MRRNIFSRQTIKLGVRLLVLTGLVVIVGCAGQYGSLDRNTEITQMFQTNSVPQEYRYYYVGHSNQPYAIIGLQPEYEQMSTLWDSVEPNTDEFARMVRFVHVPNADTATFPSGGAYILDPNDKRIGIWFSAFPFTTIKFHTENQVEVMSPYRNTRSGDGF